MNATRGGCRAAAALIVWLAVGLWPAASSIAQTPAASLPLPGGDRPGDLGREARDRAQQEAREALRQRIPRSDAAPTPAATPSLPPPPTPSAGERAAGADTDLVYVREVLFEGAPSIERSALHETAAAFLDRPLSAADLTRLRDAITKRLVAEGYLNSGALLPAQDLADGRLRVTLVEGRIGETRIRGLEHYRVSVLRERVERGLDTPFRLRDLERTIRILDQDPRIRRVEARLRPGPSRDEAILDLTVEENDPAGLRVGFDNHEPPSAGAWAGRLDVFHDNLAGFGDAAALGVSQTEGATRVLADYRFPIPWEGFFLAARGSYGAAGLVNAPFNENGLDIESESWSASFGIGKTLWHSPRDLVEVQASLERKHSRTTIGNDGFSFTEGPENGLSRASLVRLGAEWTHRRAHAVFALRTALRIGTPWFDSTRQRGSGTNGEIPDARFVSGLIQLRGIYRHPASGIEVRGRSDLQLADRPLLPFEQFSLGGPGSVRGFRRNQVVRDQGFAAGLDVRIPLLRAGNDRPLVTAGPLVDVGHGWNQDRDGFGIGTLIGVGAALEWTPLDTLSVELEWAKGLRELDRGNDLQDQSFYVRAVWWLR